MRDRPTRRWRPRLERRAAEAADLAAFRRFLFTALGRPPVCDWSGTGPVPDSAVVYCPTPRPPRVRWRNTYEGWDGVERDQLPGDQA